MKTICLFILLGVIAKAAQSQVVEKVTNINYYGYNGLNPSNITVFKDKLYFFGTNDPKYVNKLMFTADGSAAGVTVVKQIDSVKQYPSLRHLTVLNNLLIFDNYNQLWKSDGTTAGTSSLADILTGSSNYVVLNNKVYFAGDITNSNPIKDQLWQTDGTTSGTTLVKTINPSGGAKIRDMFVSGGKIYFCASDGIKTSQLWVSDGTAAGTTLLKVINSTGTADPSNFFDYNGKVYFNATDGVNGYQLWVTDGTTAGTLKITNINAPGFIGFNPGKFTLFDSKIFFMGLEPGSFYQLWSTDGTTAGTKKVKTDYTERNGVRGFNPISMAVHNNKLYLTGYDSLTKFDQLWECDGTTAGTTRITNNRSGLFPDRLFSFQNRLLFTGYDTISKQVQLFASDGTAAGTVCPTPPDTWGQYPFYPWEAWVPFKNVVYYKAAYSYFADYQLCRYTGPIFLSIEDDKRISNEFVLFQNYPNPFNSSTTIHYNLPRYSFVSLTVYNTFGQQVSQLVNEQQQEGDHEVVFQDKQLSPGTYVYRFQAGDYITSKKMTILP
jgi:ELWxxDGT repeat protein